MRMKEARGSRFISTWRKAIWRQSSGFGPSVAYNDGYEARLLRELMGIVEKNRERIERAWNEFFGS